MKKFFSFFLTTIAFYAFAEPVKQLEKLYDVLLLIALPASGKSEVRKFIDKLPKEEVQKYFNMKDIVQLDDFPYVHLMRRIYQELRNMNQDPIFFISDVLPFKNAFEWGSLTTLLNEDFDDLINNRIVGSNNSTDWLFERFDRVRSKLGLGKAFENMSKDTKNLLAKAIQQDVVKFVDSKNEEVKKGYLNKTIIIEFARGGAYGSTMPLPKPYGYEYSISLLKDEILKNASIFYIWVDPQESRRKNEKRADPNDPGSILHHSVPLAVMYNDYGLDDFDYLIKKSRVNNHIEITSNGSTYFIPAVRFDNRIDKTSFIRDTYWEKENVNLLKDELIEAFKPIVSIQ